MRPGIEHDPRRARERLDEVVRAVRWQRLAPAFGVGEAPVLADPLALADSWCFARGDTWWDRLVGHEVVQRAPARLARGCALPEVRGRDGLPYVVASRHPRGPLAIAALARAHGRSLTVPPAEIALAGCDPEQPIAVFGPVAELRLGFTEALDGRRVWAQDLAGDTAVDITGRVVRDGTRLVLPGALLGEIGTQAASPGDRSDPGTVLRLLR